MPSLRFLIAQAALISTCFSAFELAGAQTTPAGAAFTVETSQPNNSTYVLGDAVHLTFNATGLTPRTATTLSIAVKDETGDTLVTHSLLLTADASGNASVVYSAPHLEYGYYRVEATLPNGAAVHGLGTRPAGFISYAVIPDPAKRVSYSDANSRFGMCGGFSSKQGNLMQLLGARFLMDGPGWSTLEQNYSGQLAHDRAQAAAEGQVYPWHQANNSAPYPTYAISALLTKAEPTWAFIPGTGTTALPTMGILSAAGQTGFAAYAKERAEITSKDFAAQAQHYYQITWEPEVPAGFGGTPAQLVEFYKLAHAAIHAVDPKAYVMGPTMLAMDTTSLQALYAAGLANYIDGVSMHPYAHWPVEVHNLHINMRNQIAMAIAAKGKWLPFISTEHGLASGAGSVYSTGSELNQALGNIRSALIVLGEGFKIDTAFYVADFWSKSASETDNTFGYYWNLNPSMPFGTDKVGPKPAVPAYAAMTNFLDGTANGGLVKEVVGTQLGYRFTRGTTKILAMWDYEAAASIVTIPVGNEIPQICTWMGVCRSVAPTNGTLRIHVGAAPTYVIGETI